MKKVVIGIASQEDIRARARAIARGEHRPATAEPGIWFTSMRSLAEVLSDDNRALLRVIREEQPDSLSRLADLTGRAPSNPSRTLKTMERYGLVRSMSLSSQGFPRRWVRNVALKSLP
jgi:predicted transcriptional regulator